MFIISTKAVMLLLAFAHVCHSVCKHNYINSDILGV